jgi:hypothetical protein
MLDEFALTARWDDLPAALIRRYSGLAERVFPYATCIDWRGPGTARQRWREIATAVRLGT